MSYEWASYKWQVYKFQVAQRLDFGVAQKNLTNKELKLNSVSEIKFVFRV